MNKKPIRVWLENYSKLTGVHDSIIKILNDSEISVYNATGILDTKKLWAVPLILARTFFTKVNLAESVFADIVSATHF